ncbi:hypothetical protein [Agaribacterium sp. ZY112]|uniref:ApeI family dehydratase n=1 Tax=Agaribacterium sp. ZY112 TaxID=3233574 RepID=UPI003524A24F
MIQSVSARRVKLQPKILGRDPIPLNDSWPQGFSIDMQAPLDSLWFDGHFSDFQLLPGVAQLDWLIYTLEAIGVKGRFVGFDRLKFTRPLTPGICFKLELNFHIKKQHLLVKFHLFDKQSSFAKGVLLLAEARLEA